MGAIGLLRSMLDALGGNVSYGVDGQLQNSDR
jgi:hypothetical protein